MKKSILYIISVCFFFSCGKDSKHTSTAATPPPGGKTYSISFNVNTSNTATNTITNATGVRTNSIHAAALIPVSGFANQLQYWVYNSAGNLITQLYQTQATVNFGKITDTFTAGTYNIVIVAQNYRGTPLIPISAPSNFPGAINLNGNDTFFKTYPLTVSDTTSNQNITLNRIDGELQIKVTDSIPVSAKTLGIIVTWDREITTSTGLPDIQSTLNYQVPLPDSVKGKTNFTLTTYIANTTEPITVNIYGADASGVKFATATVDSVRCLVNTRTILAGNLFSIRNTDFNVTFNNTWSATPIIISFSNRPSPIIQPSK